MKRSAKVFTVAAVSVGLMWAMLLPASAVVFSNPAQIILPAPAVGVPPPTPAALYPSNIVVSGLTGNIIDVNVTLHGVDCSARTVDFAYPEDMDILVVGPTGANALIMSDAGGDNEQVPPLQFSDITLTFDDQAANQLPADTQLTSGTFRPVDDDDDVDPRDPAGPDAFAPPAPAPSGNTMLSVFNGTNPNGTWSLYVVDDFPGPDNCVIRRGWSIDILTQAATGTPTLTTAVVPSSPAVNQPYRFTATLGGGNAPTGTITFNQFAGSVCSGTPAFTDTVPVSGNGTYQSRIFATSSPQSLSFQAVYSGDANNSPVTVCQPYEVNRATPTISTQASAGGPLGTVVTDTATVAGGFNPTGTVTFNLYRDATCTTAPVFSSTNPLAGATATSAPFNPPAPGTYYWIASYSGDANNAPVSGACGDPNETVTITASTADLSLTKTCTPGPVAPGATVNCTVTVSNAGPAAAQNVAVTDDLPSGVSLVGTPAGPGFTCGVGDPFTCTLPSLAANASASFSFSVVVSENVTPGASLVNNATVSSATSDPNPGNNTATASTSVVTCTITGAGDITGTAGDDVICGSEGNDRIAGLGGNDIIFGFGGDDQLSGGDGNDILLGGAGSDSLVGGAGNDRLYGGGGGVDRLSGGLGDDYLNTVDGTADDQMSGSEGTDTCVGDGDAKALCEL